MVLAILMDLLHNISSLQISKENKAYNTLKFTTIFDQMINFVHPFTIFSFKTRLQRPVYILSFFYLTKIGYSKLDLHLHSAVKGVKKSIGPKSLSSQRT